MSFHRCVPKGINSDIGEEELAVHFNLHIGRIRKC